MSRGVLNFSGSADNSNGNSPSGGSHAMIDVDEHAATQDADDESDGEEFSFLPNGPLAQELAAQEAAAEQARFKAAIKQREHAEQLRLERKKRKREEEAKHQAATSAAQQPQAQQAQPLVAKASPRKPYMHKRVAVAVIEDPFDQQLYASPSPPPPPHPAIISAANALPPTSRLPPAQPSVSSSARTISAPSIQRTLPAQVAAFLGCSKLPPPAPVVPPKAASPPPPSSSSTANSGGIPGAPQLARAHSASELCTMRKENLAMKSNSTLLLEALMGKMSTELRAVHEVALTPAQKVALLPKPGSHLATAAAAAAATPTFASVLAQTGKRLKAKQGEGVGGNAKQRNRARRIDGFIGDVTPLLERTVDYLLQNGADANVQDADRNCPLWVALQLKGSDKIVKMLLERGAECVEALESEDESDDEEEAKHADPAAQLNKRLDADIVKQPKIEAFKPTQLATSIRAIRKAGAHPSLPETLRNLQSASGGAGDVFNFGSCANSRLLVAWCSLGVHLLTRLLLARLLCLCCNCCRARQHGGSCHEAGIRAIDHVVAARRPPAAPQRADSSHGFCTSARLRRVRFQVPRAASVGGGA